MADLIHLAIPAFVLLMVIEAVADALLRRDLYELKDAAASITMGLGNVAVNLVAKTMLLGIFGLIYRFRIFNLGYQSWVWLLLFSETSSATTGFIAPVMNAACSGHRTSCIIRRNVTTYPQL